MEDPLKFHCQINNAKDFIAGIESQKRKNRQRERGFRTLRVRASEIAGERCLENRGRDAAPVNNGISKSGRGGEEG